MILTRCEEKKKKRSCVRCGRSHLRIDFDCGDVGLPVYIPDRGLIRVAVVELHAQLGPPRRGGGRGHHVSVCHDHTCMGDDKTRAAGETQVATKQRMSGHRGRAGRGQTYLNPVLCFKGSLTQSGRKSFEFEVFTTQKATACEFLKFTMHL